MHAGIYAGEDFGRDRCASGTLPRHRHGFGYICLVLQGSFIEAGDMGRFRLQPGDALVHRPFEAHLDHFGTCTAEVLNLPLVEGVEEGFLKVADPDAVVRAAERDASEAAHLLVSASAPAEGEKDWPDLLAAALRRSPGLVLGEWGALHGLAPATVSRGFRKAYGASPARYRAEARTRRACHAVVAGGRALAGIAADLGFADQAHMCRSIRSVAGLSPARLRREGQTRSIRV